MALTAAERLSCFEILDLPPGTTGWELWGVLGEAGAVPGVGWTSPVAALDDLITALSADAEVKVQALVVQWDLVSTSEVQLTKAESVEGVVRDAAAKRVNIRKLLQVYLPLYREGEVAARQAEFQGGNQILRG